MSRRLFALLGLALILASWILVYRRTQPAALFGEFQDDTLLLSSAKALAERRGYIMPSLPGPAPGIHPVQTKYPILYPLLLSVVWRTSPGFPDNLDLALDISMAAGCLALAASYWFLRGLGIAPGLAIGITAFCAFHLVFLVHSARLMTDVPMMALTLAALTVSDRALKPAAPLWLAGIAGLLAAAAALTRTIGMTVVLAAALLALYRKRYRAGSVFLLVSIPLIAAGLRWPGKNADALGPWIRAGGPGFRQTWTFYVSYVDFWRLSVPTFRSFRAMVFLNAAMALDSPGAFLLGAPLGGWGGIVVQFLAGIATLAGVARHAKTHGWRVVHVVLGLQWLVLLVWTQAADLTQRFFLPFLPLFCVGAWTEGRRIWNAAAATLRKRTAFLEKALAAAVVLGGLFLIARGALHYVRSGWTFVHEVCPRRASLEQEKREAFSWIRTHTQAADRFVSENDAELYLHTGRLAMRPIVFTYETFYTGDERIWQQDEQHLLDAARHIGARYWMVATDDCSWCPQRRKYLAKAAEIRRAAPLVFQSSGGRVQLYDISPLTGAPSRLQAGAP
jgi:hypothetical protein